MLGLGENIVQVLSSNARKAPDLAICIVRQSGQPDIVITRLELWQRSSAFAEHLRADGIGIGDPYMIALPNRPEMLYAFFGAMIAGAIPAFMPFPTAKQNSQLFWKSHQTLFSLIEARQFLTYRANAEMAAAVPEDATVRYVEDIGGWFTQTQLSEPVPITADMVALLQHSSGTTGLKKGVMLSHAAVLHQVRQYAAAIGFGQDDVVASWLPLYHDMGLIACLMMSVLTGARLILLDPFEWVARPTLLLDYIEQHRATFAWLPNFAFLHLVRTAPPERRWDLSSMKMFINCSEPCKPESFLRFRERFSDCGLQAHALQVCYAMAENVFAVTQTPQGAIPRALSVDADALETEGRIASPQSSNTRVILSCGVPIADTDIAIWDSAHNPVPTGQVGEIAIRSNCLFTGYNKLPVLTAEKLVDGWYRTSDLGFIDGDELFVTGRQDDLMIVYGRNYYAHAVEQAASECPGVVPGRVVAFAVENDASGSRDAVVLVEEDGTDNGQNLRRLIKTRVFDQLGLVLYSVGVHPRGTLIKSTAGKISRYQNKAIYVQRNQTP
jgi:fatty-acyl-CoA synthase